MTTKPLPRFSKGLLAAALLVSAGAFAQQPPPPGGSPPPPDAQGAPITRQSPRPPRGSGMQSPPIAGSFRGDMSPGSRIAPPGLWWKNPSTITALSLTDDQQKKMDAIFQDSRLKLIDLKANVEKQEVILEPMLADNPPDTNKVLAQIDHVAQARADLEKANARMLLGIRGVLTADQWTKLQAERGASRRSMYKGSSGSTGGPGGPGGGGMTRSMSTSGRAFHYTAPNAGPSN